MATARRAIGAVLLPDGTILVAGGFLASGPLTASAERFSPATATLSDASGLSSARAPVMVPLMDGRALAIASIGRVSTTIVDIYTP